MQTAPIASSDLASTLSEQLGSQILITDAEEATFLATDVFRAGLPPVAIVAPSSRDELLRCLAIADQYGAPMVVRGGGASYTDAYLATREGTMLIDTRRLKNIDVDEANGFVTVEPGVTWAELKERLDPLDLRTPFWGPFSGIAATVAGSMSQNAISHGSGAHGVSGDSALSMEIAASDGTTFHTGTAAAGAPPFARSYGPDTTGLFCGDCGALGVKVSVTLPLLSKRQEFVALSFSYPNFAALHAGMTAAARAGLDDEHFALDAALSQGQIAREERAGRRKEMALSVLKNARSMASGVKQLAKMGLAGDRALKRADYSCHYLVHGVDKKHAEAKAQELRRIMDEVADEIPNTVPTVVQGMPFAPLFAALGPQGERWVPVHGIFSHEDVLPFHVAFDAFVEARQADFEKHGVWVGGMFENVGAAGFLYEIAMYWPDERSIYHDTMIDAEYLGNLPSHPANPAAREYVRQLKEDLVDLYQAHNAGHFQLGKAYPYWDRLDPISQQLIRSIKASTDPKGLLNPDALGIPTS
ncbi:MAG: FAD-binding oxidoreductase [Pseudomonadota bacterium]